MNGRRVGQERVSVRVGCQLRVAEHGAARLAHVPLDQARFAHTAVTEQHELRLDEVNEQTNYHRPQ